MQPMNVLVIDGQGGGLGKQLVAALSAQCPEARLTAVGTNSLAANAMRKAGAPRAATGENAVVVNCRSADIIVGPIGIVVADGLLGAAVRMRGWARSRPPWPRPCARAMRCGCSSR